MRTHRFLPLLLWGLTLGGGLLTALAATPPHSLQSGADRNVGAPESKAALAGGVRQGKTRTRGQGAKPPAPEAAETGGKGESMAPAGTRKHAEGIIGYNLAFSPQPREESGKPSAYLLAAGRANGTVALYLVRTAKTPDAGKDGKKAPAETVEVVAVPGQPVLDARGDERFKQGDKSNADLTTLGVAFNAEGNLLAAAFANGAVAIWEFKNGRFAPPNIIKAAKPANPANPANSAYAVAFQPKAQKDDPDLLAVAYKEGQVKLLDARTKEVSSYSYEHKNGKTVYNLAFDPMGEWLASGGADHQLVLATVRDEVSFKLLEGHKEQINWLTFGGPAGRWLVTAGNDAIILWEYREKHKFTPLKRDETSQAVANAVAFANATDSKPPFFLAAGYEDGVLALFKFEKGEAPAHYARLTVKCSNKAIWAVAFSHDNRLMACTDNEAIRVWKVGDLEKGSFQKAP